MANLAICGDEDTISGFSLKAFSKGLTKAVGSAAKVASAVVTKATSTVASLPGVKQASAAVQKALPVLKKLAKLPVALAKYPYKVATLPTSIAQKAMRAALKKAGMGKVVDILDAPEKLAKHANDAMGHVAMVMIKGDPIKSLRAIKAGVKELKADPNFSRMLTGTSFIPGLGSGVSAGIAAAASLGAGESLKDAALAGARNAIPGGPATKAAFDVAVGMAHGKKFSDAAILAVRQAVPGGVAGKAAFDAGLLLARRKATPSALVGIARESLPGPSKAVFDTAWRGAQVAAGKANAESLVRAAAMRAAQDRLRR